MGKCCRPAMYVWMPVSQIWLESKEMYCPAFSASHRPMHCRSVPYNFCSTKRMLKSVARGSCRYMCPRIASCKDTQVLLAACPRDNICTLHYSLLFCTWFRQPCCQWKAGSVPSGVKCVCKPLLPVSGDGQLASANVPTTKAVLVSRSHTYTLRGW